MMSEYLLYTHIVRNKIFNSLTVLESRCFTKESFTKALQICGSVILCNGKKCHVEVTFISHLMNVNLNVNRSTYQT